MTESERSDRVAELTTRLLDGLASAEESAELNAALSGDPALCERYLDIVETHAHLTTLQSEHQNVVELPFTRSSTKRRAKPTVARFSSWPIVATAASIALLACSLIVTTLSEREEEPASLAGVAVLSRVVDPVWKTRKWIEGDSLGAGEISLSSGLVQLEFFSGATVIAEGPVTIDLISADEIQCLSGRLRTFVPEPAQGFVVRTPEYNAVDLGTEFALQVEDDGTSRIHVLDGEVRIDEESGKEIALLQAGEGLESKDQIQTSSDPSQVDFVDREEMLQLSQSDSVARMQTWRRSRASIASDPDTLVLFDFENQMPWDRQLSNQIPSGPNAAIIGARWTEGRWPEKGALEFKRISDRVRLKIEGEFDELTFATSVRIEGLDRWLSSLLLTDGFEPGETHWQISDEGELVLGISGVDPINTTSPRVIFPSDLGKWVHLAVTIDRGEGIVAHYKNGDKVWESETKEMGPLRIGPAEIGNWQAEGKTKPIRSFNGRIDEFVILQRALNGEEIEKLAR